MDFVTLTIDILNKLAHFAGSYGMAIIIFTILMRVCLWPVNVSQQRSMKNMQNLTPKMKMIQEKYKNNPQLMQQKMMEFYKENNFNPTAGCLPMLIQIPIFIMLYSALMSPQFIQMAGNTNFLFINRLDATIKSNAGVSLDGKFSVTKNAQFHAGKSANVVLSDKTLENVKISKPQKAIEVQGEIQKDAPVELKMTLDNLNLSFAELNKVKEADISVMNIMTKETENIKFTRHGDILIASVPTVPAQDEVHFDVILLVALFGITIWLSQKVMMATTSNKNQDATQAAIQKSMGKIMPIMIVLTFVLIPIPAGALLYLVTSNIFQIAQTVIINKQLEIEENNKQKQTNSKENVIDAKVIDAQVVENKDQDKK
ncbi:MAG: YidC/Oxa1 family membrane protein insertase [Candidatus Gastranaerophilales bacterium]|nr:YidC/Oxa1 family membrane protein insertase [Candidatus Gastranaerophilales bacterium]